MLKSSHPICPQVQQNAGGSSGGDSANVEDVGKKKKKKDHKTGDKDKDGHPNKPKSKREIVHRKYKEYNKFKDFIEYGKSKVTFHDG